MKKIFSQHYFIRYSGITSSVASRTTCFKGMNMSYFIHQIMEDRRNFKLKYLLSLPYSTVHWKRLTFQIFTAQSSWHGWGRAVLTTCCARALTIQFHTREERCTEPDFICNGGHRIIPGYTRWNHWLGTIQQKKHHTLHKHFQLWRAITPFEARIISCRSILPIRLFSVFLILSSKLLECFLCHFYSRSVRVFSHLSINPGTKNWIIIQRITVLKHCKLRGW